jgi:hypothetical protein
MKWRILFLAFVGHFLISFRIFIGSESSGLPDPWLWLGNVLAFPFAYFGDLNIAAAMIGNAALFAFLVWLIFVWRLKSHPDNK